MKALRFLAKLLPSPFSGVSDKSLKIQDKARKARVSNRIATELGRGSVLLGAGKIATRASISARYERL